MASQHDNTSAAPKGLSQQEKLKWLKSSKPSIRRVSSSKFLRQDREQAALFARVGHTWNYIKRAGDAEDELKKPEEALSNLHETFKTHSADKYLNGLDGSSKQDLNNVWKYELTNHEQYRGPAGELAVHLCFLLPDTAAKPEAMNEIFVFLKREVWLEAAAFDKYEDPEFLIEEPEDDAGVPLPVPVPVELPDEKMRWRFRVKKDRDVNQTRKVAQKFLEDIRQEHPTYFYGDGVLPVSVVEQRFKENDGIRKLGKRMLFKCPEEWNGPQKVDKRYPANLINAPYSFQLEKNKFCKYHGETVLHIAIVNNEIHNVRWLVESGASLLSRATGLFFQSDCPFGEYPINFAVSNGSLEIVKYLWERGEQQNLSEETKMYKCKELGPVKGNNILHMAVLRARLDLNAAREIFRYLFRTIAGIEKKKLETDETDETETDSDESDWKLEDATYLTPNDAYLSPLSLAVHEGLDGMVDAIIEELQDVQWIYGPITSYRVPLLGIDTIRPRVEHAKTAWKNSKGGKKQKKENVELPDVYDAQSNRDVHVHIPYVHQPIKQSMLALASQNGRYKMLNNRILKAIIQEKWERFGLRWFRVSLIMYIGYLAMFTVLVTYRRGVNVTQGAYEGHILRAWRPLERDPNDGNPCDDALELMGPFTWIPEKDQITSAICVESNPRDVGTGAKQSRDYEIWVLEGLCLFGALLKCLHEFRDISATWTYLTERDEIKSKGEHGATSGPQIPQSPASDGTPTPTQTPNKILARKASFIVPDRFIKSSGSDKEKTEDHFVDVSIRLRRMQNGFGGDSIITTRSRGFSEIKLNGSEIGPNGSAPATPEKRATNSDQTPGNEDHDENDEVLSDHLWNQFLDLPIVRMMTEFFLNLYLSSERNAIIVFVFTFLYIWHFILYCLERDTEANVILATSVPFVWVYSLSYFARGFKFCSKLVAALDAMVVDCIQFGTLYGLFIVAFACSLYLCYDATCASIAGENGVAGTDSNGAPVTCKELVQLGLTSPHYAFPFRSMQSSILYLFRMSLGGADFGVIEASSGADAFVTHTVFAAFNVIVVLVLINTLIAMLSSTYARLADTSDATWIRQKARIVLSTERSLYTWYGPPLFLSNFVYSGFLPLLSAEHNRVRTTWIAPYDGYGKAITKAAKLTECFVFNSDTNGTISSFISSQVRRQMYHRSSKGKGRKSGSSWFMHKSFAGNKTAPAAAAE
ncbi:ion transport protein [Pycnococcus provasolii]